MLDHPTLDQLKTLRLDGMAEAFAEMQSQDGTADLTHAEWLGLLVDRESSSRETKRFESRMRAAKLRHGGAVPEDVDYKTRRGLDKALFQQMLTGRWIKHKRNLMPRRDHWPPVAWAKPGWPVRWLKPPAETGSPCSTNVCRVCLMNSNWPTGTGASRACSKISPKPNY